MRPSLLSSLLPALFPSWRFFDRIGPAPQVEYAWGATAADAGHTWRALRQEPLRVLLPELLASLVWNPDRNESLFLVSYAERLLDDPTPARAELLWTRAADLACRARRANDDALPGPAGYLRVRIVEVTRDGDRLARDVMYVSEARPLR